MAIDVGNTCIDRSNASGNQGYTDVDKANPANAAGTIDSVCVYIQVDTVSALEFGAFTDNGSNSLTCQTGHHCSGAGLSATIAESPKTFTAPGDFTAFSIDSGEYIGEYHTGGGGSFEAGDALSGLWYCSGDKIGDNITETFTWFASWGLSLYATGTEAGAANAPTGTLYGPLVGPMGGPI